jgi:hypothetical protein
MKNIAILAAAASVMMAAPAMAANPQQITVNGKTAPQCAINANQTTVSFAASMANTSGFARTDIANDVATALTGAGVVAWCSGAKNTVVLSRTALKKGNGLVDASGFANGVVYDLEMKILDAFRSDNNSNTLDGTSDGAGNGPGIGIGAGLSVESFGPTGTGSAVLFAAEAGSASAAITAFPGTGDGNVASFAPNNANRLAAGDYQSTVTLTLTPGV